MDGEAGSSAVPVAASATVATPAPTPAAPSAPAPATTPVVDTTASAPQSEVPAQGQEKDFILGKLANLKFDGTDPEPTPEDNLADLFKPAEEKPAAAIEEPKPEDKPADDPNAPKEPEGEPFELEPLGIITAEGLAKDLKDKPELAAALEKYPDVKNTIFAAARRSARADEFEQIFATPAEANVAAEASTNLSTLSDLVTNATSIESARDVIKAMVGMSVLMDEDGNPLKDDKGNIRTDGSVGRFASNLFGANLDMWAARADQHDDAELAAAVDVLKARAGFAESASPNNEGLTEEQQRRQTELDAQAKRNAEETRTLHNGKVEAFETKVESGIEDSLKTSISNILKTAALGEFDRDAAAGKIRSQIYGLIKGNQRYQHELDTLSRKPMTDKVAKERVALAAKYVTPYLHKVARTVLAEAGVKVMAKQDATLANQAARSEASRSEINASPRVAAPAQGGSSEQRYAADVDALTQSLGRTPEAGEIVRYQLQQRLAR